MTEAEMKAMIEKLQAENAQLKAMATAKLAIKISEKGAVSVYGVGRFPATFYRGQWLALLDYADNIKAFIEANKAKLDAVEEANLEARAEAKALKAKQDEAARQARVASLNVTTDDKGRPVTTGSTQRLG